LRRGEFRNDFLRCGTGRRTGRPEHRDFNDYFDYLDA
jgi:hypothetical protein